jgi:hypothetical protein
MSDYAERPVPPARREERDVGVRAVGIGLALVLLTAMLLAGLCWWLFPASLRDQARLEPVPAFPAPTLQPSPPVDMSRFLQDEARALGGTYWTDRAHGLVHVPIDEAMRRVAQDGIADWPKTAPAEVQR